MGSFLRLKRIELFGFKSFADKTVLEFGEGVSGVVGPNGCGKSNVVDAFRWVMGEQSAKSMRGEKMFDVIFSGASGRKPANFAEVTLVFENGGLLEVDFAEVAITRRLTRAGESTYSLNGRSVRLKDIQTLFADVPMAIFEQGRIDEVVLRSAEERRPMFERAAGIGKYRQQWREAARKLAQTEANLVRVEDIVREVEKQLKVLERQMVEAKEFKANKARLIDLEQGLLVARLRKAEGRRQGASQELARAHEVLAKAKSEVEEAEKRRLEAKAQVAEKEQLLTRLRESLYRVKSEQQVRSVEGESDKQRLEEALRRERQLVDELETLEARSGDEAKESERLREEVAALQVQVSEAEKAFSAQREVQREVSAMREEQMALVQGQARTEGELREVQMRIEAGREKLERLSEVDGQLEEAQKAVDLLSEGAAQKRAELEQIDLKGVREEVENHHNQLRKIKSELSEKEARLRALERIKRDMEGLSKSTKKILKAFPEKARPLYEVVNDPVMHPYSQTLMVDEGALDEVLDFARDLKDFSLTTESWLEVDFESVDEPRKPGQVSPDGIFMDRRGVLFFPGKGGVFERQKELKELERAVQALRKSEQEVAEALESSKAQRRQLEEERSKVDQEQRQAEMELAEARFALTRLEKERARLGQVNLDELEGKLTGLMEGQQSKRATLASLEGRLEERLSRLKGDDSEESYNQLLKSHREVESRLRILEVRSEERIRQKERIASEQISLAEKKQALEERLSTVTEEVAEIEARVNKAIAGCELAQADLRGWRRRLEEAESEVRSKGVHEAEEAAHRIEIKLAHESSIVDQLLEQIDFEHEGQEFPILETLDQTEREVKRLRRIVDRADHINLASIDEHAAAKERHGYLSGQIADLEKAKSELDGVIAELDALSREKFQTTFEAIRQNFQKQFKILFEGGEADLKLVGSEDILEAGIDLVAKPPGKQMRSIKLLSGGEKCMTAMALLFAIFEVAPAPYCILDEMDAPLDDANVKRFLNVVRPFMEKTQFVIITHNKLTMEIADILYGISMEEKGVSKQISIKFEAAACS